MQAILVVLFELELVRLTSSSPSRLRLEPILNSLSSSGLFYSLTNCKNIEFELDNVRFHAEESGPVSPTFSPKI